MPIYNAISVSCYANQAGENMFTIIAADNAGNWSAPASVTILSQQLRYYRVPHK